jgi:lactoylglutathione lyase
VEGTARDLQGKGVEFVTEPTKAPWGTFAIFKDQDDNRFVLGTK